MSGTSRRWRPTPPTLSGSGLFFFVRRRREPPTQIDASHQLPQACCLQRIGRCLLKRLLLLHLLFFKQ